MGPSNQDTEDMDVVSDWGRGGALEPGLTYLPEAHRIQETWALTTGQGAELTVVATQEIQGQEKIDVASSEYKVPSGSKEPPQLLGDLWECPALLL